MRRLHAVTALACLSACATGHWSLPGDPPLGAPLEVATLRRYVRNRIDRLQACYQSGLVERPALRGRLVLRFDVLPDGEIAATRVAEDEVGDPGVARCVVGALAAWRTPFRPPEPTSVEYPFVFGPR